MLQSVSSTLRVAVVAAGIALVAPPLIAQDASGPPPGPPPSGDNTPHRHGPHDPGAMLLKGITLTSDQQAQIKSIHERYHAAMDSAWKSGNKDRSGMHKMMEAQMADVRGVLTSDQQKIFDVNVAEMKQHRQQMRQQQQGQPSN